MSELYTEWEERWAKFAEENRGDVLQVGWIGLIARDAFEAGYLAGREDERGKNDDVPDSG